MVEGSSPTPLSIVQLGVIVTDPGITDSTCSSLSTTKFLSPSLAQVSNHSSFLEFAVVSWMEKLEVDQEMRNLKIPSSNIPAEGGSWLGKCTVPPPIGLTKEWLMLCFLGLFLSRNSRIFLVLVRA